MAQYKVPQDVEADDKLLGPFTFRQFIYLMIMGGCIGLAFAFFQIFPLLAVIPVPFIIFFAALALPIKRDQPMETYLAAIISYHLKPKNRLWQPGQRESTIQITAPKIVEKPRTRNLSEEEAGNRLSFLANVIDTEGYAVRGDLNNAPMRAQFVEEANSIPDILDVNASNNINQILAKQQNARHEQLLNQMRTAINSASSISQPNYTNTATINPISTAQAINPAAMPLTRSAYNTQPGLPPVQPTQSKPIASPAMQNLANNQDYSIATISKEAARIEKENR